MNIFINDVLELGGNRFRLLKVVKARLHPPARPQVGATKAELAVTPNFKEEPGCYVISLGKRKPVPEFWKLTELNQAVRVATGSEAAPYLFDGRPRDDRKADIAVRDLRWGRIRELIDDDRIWEPHTRASLLVTHGESIGCRAQTLMECLRMYWMGGQVIDSLLGNFYNCGYVDKDTEGAQVFRVSTAGGEEAVIFATSKGKPRGRRWGGEAHLQPFAFSPNLRRVVSRVACKHYLQDYSKSKRSAATKVLMRVFCERDENGAPLRDERGFVVLKPRGQRPSVRQIIYVLDKVLPHSKADASRYGAAEYKNNNAPHPGSVRDDCLGAGDVFEIDATLVDLTLVSRANRAKIIGKAVLYLVVDRGTNLIVGFYLSLENPSWSEAQHAILSVGGDWKKLCERFRLPYNSDDWPAHMWLPNRFFGDRAEMMVGATEALTDGARVQVTNAPPLMSSYKPMVEIDFKLVHLPLRGFAPGYEPPENFKKRRGKKYAKDACLTFDELGACLLLAVWTHNTSIRQNYDATPAEAMSDIPLTPVNLWNLQTRQTSGIGVRMPVEVLRRKLLSKGQAVVKNDGIHFGHCIYYKKELDEWFVTASIAGSFGVQVSYTSNLVDEIKVWDPDDARKSYDVELGPKSVALKGWNFREVDILFTNKRKRKNDALEANQTQRVTAAIGIEAIAEAAMKQTREVTQGMLLGTRMAGGPELREQEARERRYDVHQLSATHDPFGSSFPLMPDKDDDDWPDNVSPVDPPPAHDSHVPAAPECEIPADAATDEVPEVDAPYESGATVAPDTVKALKRLLLEEAT